MKPERLLGGAIGEQLNALNAAKWRKEFDRKATAERTQEMAARMRPFHALNQRNRAVIRAVSEITSDADEVSVGNDNRKKIVIPVGAHPKTGLTPDHVAMCGVAYIKAHPGSTEEQEYAEFTFAIVPAALVNHFIQDPHDLHNPEREDIIRFDDAERTFCERDILSAGAGVVILMDKRKSRNAALVPFETNVVRAEENLHMVAAAMATRFVDSIVVPN